MDSEDITSLCASMSINKHDGPSQLLDGKLMMAAINRLELCLVGKVLTNKRVNREAFIRVIGKNWKVKKGVEIELVTGNTFTFHFRDKYDLDRVMVGSPWNFDNALITMVIPSGQGTIDSLEEIWEFLGGMIGEVIEMDRGASGDCVGKFMRVRVRVRVDIQKSLKRCLRVDILGDRVETTMILQYERLLNHYFKCGMVNHITFECSDEDPLDSNWRKDRGTSNMELDSMEGKGKEGVIHEVSISIAGSLNTQVEITAAADVMAVEVEEIISDSPTPRPVVLVNKKQSAMVDSLVHQGTEIGSINCKTVVYESCVPSKTTGDELIAGINSKIERVSLNEDSSIDKAQLGEVLVTLNPVIPGGPFPEVERNGPVHEVQVVVQ
ncbi:hypothetical protein EZV62_015216 [Acer yangbiense]|uniref:DUF4283 domain-containing protein n=1 Tax=Acer yangbiense TaxID=1000413 RepID=A0A5C7HU53_9ROSI|nr:hypothetical protein EZV62_015216 [Acer yangbiense]